MKTKYKISALLIIVLSLQACSPTYNFDASSYFKSKNYNKEMPFNIQGGNVSPALLKQRGNASNNADLPKYDGTRGQQLFKNNRFNFSAAPASHGGDLKITYSPVKKFMLTVTLSGISKTSVEEGRMWATYTRYDQRFVDGWMGGYYTTDTTVVTEHLFYDRECRYTQSQKEFAVGYYSSLGSYGIYEATAGWGFGSAKTRYQYSLQLDPSYSAVFSESRNYYRIFLQNNLGYSTKVTEGALCMRFSYLRFTSRDFITTYEIPADELKKANVIVEPALHFGIGGKKLRGFMEWGVAVPIGNYDVDWNSTFRVGASFKI